MFLPALSLSSFGLPSSNLVAVKLLETIGAIVAAGIFFTLFGRFVRRIGRLAGARVATDHAIRDVVSVLWIVSAAIAILTIWNLTSLFGILTVSGIAGLVISLALQATLQNMIAGVFLMRDHLLRVGDEIEYSGIRGTVIRVALRNTWVLTHAGSVAVIGNTYLANGPLINHSASPAFALSYGGGMAALGPTLRGTPPVAPASPAPSEAAAASKGTRG
jgi:small-conductance mechanosensitive channel